MRETNSHGKEVISLPHDVIMAVNKLATLGAIGAKRQWETAAIVALICESKGRGRPSKSRTSSDFTRMSISDLARKGIYGLQSQDSIRAYLRAWELTGARVPAPGEKVELPDIDFPDYAELYGRLGSVEPAEPPVSAEEADPDDCTEEDTEEPQKSSLVRAEPKRNVASMLDSFLQILGKADPAAIVHGQSYDKVELLIKTMESWIDSLREAVKDGE